MVFDVIGVIFIIFSLSLLFVLSGWSVYRYSIIDAWDHPLSLRLGFGYFLGSSLFIVLYKCIASISNNALLSLGVSVLLLILLSAVSVKKLPVKNMAVLLNYKVIIFLLIVFIYIFNLWAHAQAIPVPMLEFSGSLHTGRYGNIAAYILSSNTIPCLSQNYAQSILSTVPMFLGFNNPFFALYTWLSVSVFVMTFTFYGFLKLFSINDTAAKVGTFVLMCGQTSLSLTYLGVIDSGFPLALNGYTDSINSVGSILLFFVWFSAYRNRKHGNLFLALLVPVILGIAWNLYAPQNIAVTLAMVGLFFLVDCIRKTEARQRGLLLSLVFLLSVVLGARQGGMLAPKSIIDNVNIPGVMAPYTATGKKINLFPGIPFFIARNKNYDCIYKLDVYKALSVIFRSKESINSGQRAQAIWTIETIAWESIRAIFFPFLGTVWLWFIIRKDAEKDGDCKALEKCELLSCFFYVNLISFAVGFAIAFFLQISYYKMELSRFMLPWYCFGMASLVISLYIWSSSFKRRSYLVAAWVCLVLFTTKGYIPSFVGNISHFFTTITVNRIETVVKPNGISIP